jgi:hypothetical protein
MAYHVEDGKGSRDRAQVIENRVRIFAASVSLINHYAGEPTEGEAVVPTTGMFDARTVTSVAGSGGSLIYLANNSLDNVVVIDRMYTNAIVSATALPNTSTYVQVLMGSAITPGTGTIITATNTNRAIGFVQPDITLFNGATTSGGVENTRRYLNISRVYFQEPIIQKSDGIILGTGNSIEFFLATLTSATVEINMRFGIVTTEDVGI